MKVLPHGLKFRLQTKLTLLIAGLVIVLVVVSGIITTMREKETLESELHKRGLALANDLAKFSASPLLSNDLAILRRFVNNTRGQDYVRYVAILDPRGKVIMHSDLAQVGRIRQDGLAAFAISSPTAGCAPPNLSAGPKIQCNIFAPVAVAEARLGTVLLGYSYTAVEKEIARAERQIFFIGIIMIVSGGIMAYLLASFISLPIRKITGAIESLANGELETSLNIRRNDEIGTLANSFNKMAEDLGTHRKHLEVLVEARTAALLTTNEQLQQEIAERARTEEKLQRSRRQLRDLATHLQYIREEERIQIAREIHDELGQALTALKMDVHWLGQRLSPGQKASAGKIKSMSGLIDTTVQAVRRISSELRPKLLDDLGLSAAMEWQANEFKARSGIICQITSEPEDIILDQVRSTAFFRIFQETLTNIIRHSQATKVEVVLRQLPDRVELSVQDNGQGITAEEIIESRSLGIIGMRERALSLGGELHITGIRQRGTLVQVSIPLSKPGGGGA
jgi:signal transduction histidine kinase